MEKKINKKALAEVLADKYELTKKDSAAIVDTLFDEIVKNVKKKNVVDIAGFGKFANKHKPARNGINPLTKEKVKIAAKNVPTFKPAKAFKEAL